MVTYILIELMGIITKAGGGVLSNYSSPVAAPLSRRIFKRYNIPPLIKKDILKVRLYKIQFQSQCPLHLAKRRS